MGHVSIAYVSRNTSVKIVSVDTFGTAALGSELFQSSACLIYASGLVATYS